ncbi:hypothetical protein BUALT_Bualt10G0109500 [Buddleja alternifolia]|uniref:Uncharacterized protein n=1 Tax=Buddleja alternifolia TaxID=168488 RepID=A0AAV6X518_9LAMI|nr:hypothetical protein BUALT_Bualt10G0109500 [Buddleja alternifolia]
MVSVSNDGLSGEVSNKRPLENGYVPKYKPRKVSATRDFPPGCGRNVVPMNLKPEENSSNGASLLEVNGVKNPEMTNSVVANGVGILEMTNLVEAEAVGNPEMTNTMETAKVKTAEAVKVSGTKTSEIENVVGSNGIQDSSTVVEYQLHDAVHNSMDVDITESLDALIEKVAMTVNDVEKLRIEMEPLGIQLPSEVEHQTRAAVNNPIEVERAKSLNALVGDVATMQMDGFPYDVEDLKIGTELVGVDALNDRKSDSPKEVVVAGSRSTSIEINEVEGLTLVQNSGVEAKSMLGADASVDELLLPCNSQSNVPETPIRPKNKYRRRRVSAVRDFPPHCGRNVPLPTEGEKQIVTLGNDCLDTAEKVKVESEALRNGSDRGALIEMPMTSQKECLEGLDKVHVRIEAETSNDGAGKGPLGDMLVGNARTIAFQEITEDTVERGERKARRAVLGSETMSKAVVDDSIEDSGGAVDKDIVNYSPDRNYETRPPRGGFSPANEFYREVVHGLMAEPYCPWRKAKVALNNSDGRKSGRKVTSQKQKSKVVALNNDLEADGLGGSFMKKKSFPDSYDTDGSTRSLSFMDEEDCGAYDECLPVTHVSMSKGAVLENSDKDSAGDVGKEIVLYSQGEDDNMRSSHSVFSSVDEVDREIVHGLMAAPMKGKVVSSNEDGGMSGGNKRKQNVSWRKKAKAVAKKSNPPKVKSSFSGVKSKKQEKNRVSNDTDGSHGALVLVDEEAYGHDGDEFKSLNSPMSSKTRDFDISLPPFGPNNSSNGDARHKVRETLRLFHGICRKLLQQEEANSIPEEEGKSKTAKKPKRIDLLTAKIIKDKGKEVNTSQQFLGQVPGVEVGDEFQYRVELAVVGIHRLYQAGIDSMELNGVRVATSIVSSGAYADDVENADVLIYSGQGGNIVGKCKVPEDQKLEKGNLALRNSISAQTPVRVVRGWKETKVVDPLDSRAKIVTTYVYDGLYTVKNYWTETGSHGKLVFMFELRRNPGQPDLAWKELKKSSKSKFRPGVCVNDISEGKEPFPICAVNTIDDEKPPPFNYVSKMMYPDWHHPIPPMGCDCTGRCSDSKKCKCAVRNGGEIPYNRNGALVETKTLVYECGPHCKCPPSCYNRVSQKGVKFQLEIFKTESRGWGVRPLTSIPSGCFICEYAGELLEDKEAEKKIGSDEYLFDIGHNYIDSSIKPEEQALAIQLMEEGGGYTIDAAIFGNIGRFVNHSCSPNLYAQNVIYDHDDKKMPHVMLFAMENIPPLKELTYDYNYTVDQIRDSNGNIKVKKCYCGAAECTGRLY